MKRAFIFMIYINVFLLVTARSTVTTNGNYYQKDNMTLSYTIGELIVGSNIKQDVIIDNGFSDFNPEESSFNSIDDVTLVDIIVYPNPVSDFIKVFNIDKSYDFALFDALGIKVLDGTLIEEEAIISMLNQPLGYYILCISEKGKIVKTINIIKK